MAVLDMKRKTIIQLVWKGDGAQINHHYLYTDSFTAERILKNQVRISVNIEEYDDGENIPNGHSESELKRIKKKFEDAITKGTFDKMEDSNGRYAWPKGLKIEFTLQNGESFIQKTLEMMLEIFSLMEFHCWPSTKNLSIVHTHLIETSPENWIEEDQWIRWMANKAKTKIQGR